MTWDYRARVTRVIDGDTLDVTVDVGFHLYTTQRLRLAGIDTPEKRGPEREAGIAAAVYVSDWVHTATVAAIDAGETWPFLIHTEKADAFGRWLTDVLATHGPDGRTLGQAILHDGHGLPWHR